MAKPYSRYFSGKWEAKHSIAISMIAIMAASYSVFYYHQTVNLEAVRDALFEQQKELQAEAASSAALNIRRSLELTMANLVTLAEAAPIREGDLGGEGARGILTDNFARLDIVMDRLIILDAAGTVRVDVHRPGLPDIEGQSMASRNYVRAVQSTKASLYSNGYAEEDGRYRIAITYPILDKQTGEYRGALSTSASAISFFEKFDNVHDARSRHMVVYDRNAMILASPVREQVGVGIFGEQFERWWDSSGDRGLEEFRKFTSAVLSGRPAEQVFGSGADERLVVAQPVAMDGRPTYFINIVNPTSVVYSNIDGILFGNNLMTFALLVATSSAVAILVVIMFRWNTALDAKVQERTAQLKEKTDELTMQASELEMRTKELELANEQLKEADRMQKEFINIAAHELRTPVQPIIGMAQLLGAYPQKAAAADDEEGELTIKKRDLRIIARNAARLARLSSDILDVTRIESNSLRLSTDTVDLDQLASDAIEDAKKLAKREGVKFALRPSGGLVAEADRGRVMQVLSNLLVNAIKFTEAGGIITVTVRQAGSDDGLVLVSVRDTGSGIDPAMMPRLFTKFSSTTTSTSGTGLGLYISKAIVEAHGGKIWAENNCCSSGDDSGNDPHDHGEGCKGAGATFTFTLPLASVRK